MYVDYQYYSAEYGGTMPKEVFPAEERRAEAYIRYLTYLNGDIFATEVEAVKQAVCAAADVYYVHTKEMAQREQEGRAGTAKSENNDGHSVSYVTEQTDGETAEALLKRKVYEAVYPYLLPTGWLSRKVGRHDHKCRHHGI